MARRALLLATTTFADENLARLASPGADAAEMHALLGDEAIGAFEAELLVNTGADVARQRIEHLFLLTAGSEDLVLFFYSGHGVKDDAGRLYLATADTRLDRLRTTGVSAEFLNDVMSSCRALQQLIVLDCCYSGAFAPGLRTKGDPSPGLPQVLGDVNGRGRVVLTASNAVQYSFEAPGGACGRSRSTYSGGLLDGIRTGEADLDGDGVITASEWHRFAVRRVAEQAPSQQPRMWQFELEREPAIARGRREASQPGLAGHLGATAPRSNEPAPNPPSSASTASRKDLPSDAVGALPVVILHPVPPAAGAQPWQPRPRDTDPTAVMPVIPHAPTSPHPTEPAPTPGLPAAPKSATRRVLISSVATFVVLVAAGYAASRGRNVENAGPPTAPVATVRPGTVPSTRPATASVPSATATTRRSPMTPTSTPVTTLTTPVPLVDLRAALPESGELTRGTLRPADEPRNNPVLAASACGRSFRPPGELPNEHRVSFGQLVSGRNSYVIEGVVAFASATDGRVWLDGLVAASRSCPTLIAASGGTNRREVMDLSIPVADQAHLYRDVQDSGVASSSGGTAIARLGRYVVAVGTSSNGLFEPEAEPIEALLRQAVDRLARAVEAAE